VDTTFVAVGKALGAPARSAMVSVLLDGDRHPAGELARAAGVSSSTASEHLAVLVESGMVTARQDGRHRYFRIADHRVAEALESLGDPVGAPAVTSLRLSREQRQVRAARTCYDHLAGVLGVELLAALRARDWLGGRGDEVTTAGEAGFAALGIDLDDLRRGRRPLLRSCPDWTERRDHLAGGLGAALASTALGRSWVSRRPGSRGLLLNPVGRAAFAGLGVQVARVDAPAATG
jgi:DNA-binding transcriptional ArsR family regulator